MNLLEPIHFEQAVEAQGFVRDHACGQCLGPLVVKPNKGGGFYAECLRCGAILQHNHVTKTAAVNYEAGCRVARIELNAMTAPKRSEAELLAELGF